MLLFLKQYYNFVKIKENLYKSCKTVGAYADYHDVTAPNLHVLIIPNFKKKNAEFILNLKSVLFTMGPV